MTIEKSETLLIQSEPDVVLVRQAVRTWSVELQFGSVDQTKIVTAASEIARNTLVYGGGGTATLEMIRENLRRGLRVCFADEGPGIPDIERALTSGFTTGGSLGLGLGGAKRLVNEFYIESKLGEGTRVTLVRWK